MEAAGRPDSVSTIRIMQPEDCGSNMTHQRESQKGTRQEAKTTVANISDGEEKV